ncbi:hypothetical protein [Pseudomonas sp. GOM6]|uniref:hypothetical protein n=1 Tax=Pseudomonas sp. GOM6 TaxID=3036944 RepID=UPI00240A693F|nr:hypothetical protein [Pseudomonas sp. GOM6]MDG1581286.1 hypothetical protein [Pseudomonas sp. GOM6]
MTQKEKADQQASPKNQTPPNDTRDSSLWSHVLAYPANVLIGHVTARSEQVLRQTNSAKATE